MRVRSTTSHSAILRRIRQPGRRGDAGPRAGPARQRQGGDDARPVPAPAAASSPTVPREGFSDTVQILASGATPGLLQPGESFRVPVYWGGLRRQTRCEPNPIDFELTVSTQDQTDPMDWNALRDTLRPPHIAAGRLGADLRQPGPAGRPHLGRLRPHAQRQRRLPRPAGPAGHRRRRAVRLRAAAGDRAAPRPHAGRERRCRGGDSGPRTELRPVRHQLDPRPLRAGRCSAAAGTRHGRSGSSSERRSTLRPVGLHHRPGRGTPPLLLLSARRGHPVHPPIPATTAS